MRRPPLLHAFPSPVSQRRQLGSLEPVLGNTGKDDGGNFRLLSGKGHGGGQHLKWGGGLSTKFTKLRKKNMQYFLKLHHNCCLVVYVFIRLNMFSEFRQLFDCFCFLIWFYFSNTFCTLSLIGIQHSGQNIEQCH